MRGLILLLIFLSAASASAQTSTNEIKPTPPGCVTVQDVVKERLRQLDPTGSAGLLASIQTSTYDKWHMFAVFRKLQNGKTDTAIWEFVQGHRQNIMHDNQFMSRLNGNGTESYRERSRPSLQIVFLYHKGSKVPYGAKMDLDRFPPGASYVTSVRHLFQEQIRHKIFRGEKDYSRLARSLQRINTQARAVVADPTR